jgi:predicted 2-oxoglutarate/Fe(II)-dependent dioxygenase YbiX
MQHAFWWKWEQQISKDLCEVVFKDIANLQKETAVVLKERDKSTAIDKSQRNNDVVFLPTNHWLEGVLYNHIRHANKAGGWDFDIADCEPVQIAMYSPGQFYDWHCDASMLIKGTPRKLSAVLQLSDAADFTGGGLFIDGIEESCLNNQGDLIVFPSFFRHKAAEVLTGTRYTAVCWVNGAPFK